MILTSDNRVKVGRPDHMVGEIRMWPTGTPPANWLICDGSSISTTTYADLFDVIGYVFGGGGASFNIPDFRDRVPQGQDLPSEDIGDQVGLKLQTAVPQHNHYLPNGQFAGSTDRCWRPSDPYSSVWTGYTGVASVDQRGPRLAINFIIRY